MISDKEMLSRQRLEIHDLRSKLATWRAIFIRYVHEHEPAPWGLAEEIVDMLLGREDDPPTQTCTIPAQTVSISLKAQL